MLIASKDRLARIIPLAMVAFAVLMALIGAVQGQQAPWTVYAMPGGILLLVLAGCWLYAPLGYTVENGSLLVQRRIGAYRLPLSQVRAVRRISEDELGRVWRMAGNGGVFGYTGYFSSSLLGRMRWFVTQRRHYVLIERHAGIPLLFSPDDPDALIAALS